MAQTFKLPKQNNPSIYRIEPFAGLDLSATPTQIDDHHSPDMLNMNTDERGALNKRTGYDRVYTTSLGTGKINGLFLFTKSDGTTVLLIAHGTSLYTQSGSSQPVSIYSTKANADTSFFVMQDKCYIMDGTNYLVYDGTTVSQITPYIPTLSISNTPTGGGSSFEDFNLLGAGFKQQFSGTGTDTTFQLSLKGLDSTTVKANVDAVDKTEGTDFTVDRVNGKVTFTTAPSSGGTNNVIITAYKTYSDKPNYIKKCVYNIEYGGNNDSHVFVSGNPDYKNRVWRSGVYDPTYFPENGFYNIGSSNEKVQGFVKQYDYLVIEKEHSKWNMIYSLDSSGNVSFPTKPINSQAGTLAPKSIQIIENNPVSLDEKGVYELVSSNVRDENNIQLISYAINNKLLKEPNLKNAVSIDFDRKYWLAVNGNVYVYDYQQKEWYIYDNINVNWFIVMDLYLYFGSSTDGLLYKFKKSTDSYPYNDDGVAINAYWRSKLIDFQAPEMTKMVRSLFMTLAPDVHTSANIYIRTDKKGETLIDSPRMDQFNLLYLDLTKFSLITSDIPQEIKKKIKEKKITHVQLKLENNALNESLGVTSLGINYVLQNYVR